MNYYKGIFFIFFYISFSVAIAVSEDNYYEPYRFPEKIPEKHLYNPHKDYEKILNEHYDRKWKNYQIKKFAEVNAFNKKKLFESGFVYLDLNEVETYLNKVLKKVLPDSLKGSGKLHVYPARSHFYNAFTLHDGTLFMNIGLLAEVHDEAALGIILAHEVAHYLEKDIKNRFYQVIKTHNGNNGDENFSEKLENAAYSRKQEKTADSIGYELAMKAGYDLESGIINYKKFIDQEKAFFEGTKVNKSIQNISSEEERPLLASHPETRDRINVLENKITETESTEKNNFLADQSQFKKCKKIARIENLELLLNSNKNLTCIKNAMRYHLLSADNEQYLYYLLEAIRRTLYLNPDMGDDPFLNMVYEDSLEADQSVLSNLNLLLSRTSQSNEGSKHELFHKKENAFHTYEEAFAYFEKTAYDANYPEIDLTLALYYYQDWKDKAGNYINQYLSADNARHKDYAKALKKGELMKGFSSHNKELVIFDDIQFIEDRRYGYDIRRFKSVKERDTYTNELKKVAREHFPQKQIAALPRLKKDNFQQAMAYKRLLNTAIHASGKYAFSINEKMTEKQKERGSDADNYEKKGETIYFDKWMHSQKKIQDTSTYIKNWKISFIDPFYWKIIRHQKLKRMEYLKTRAFNDKASIAGNIAKSVFYTIFTSGQYLIYSYFINGTFQYDYKLTYAVFSCKHNDVKVHSKNIDYKLKKLHFGNSVYHAFSAFK